MPGDLEPARPTGGMVVSPRVVSYEEQYRFAQALSKGDLLPPQYRDGPGRRDGQGAANVMLAIQYAESLRLPVAQVFSGIHVIEGRPSMSAELMQAVIRRAGHRIRLAGDNQQATCAITRADDPEFTYTATFTLADAEQAGLLRIVDGKVVSRTQNGKPSNWEKHPAAMLRARATSACARMACADALAGISYVPDELDPGVFAGGTPDPTPPAAEHPSPRPAADANQRQDLADRTVDADPAPPTSSSVGSAEEENRRLWVEQWQLDLGRAVHDGDLGAVQAQAQKAANANMADLVAVARDAWSRIQDRNKAAAEAVQQQVDAARDRAADQRPPEQREADDYAARTGTDPWRVRD